MKRLAIIVSIFFGCASHPSPAPVSPRLCIIPEMVAIASTIPEAWPDVVEAEKYWSTELGRPMFIDLGLTDHRIGAIVMIEHGDKFGPLAMTTMTYDRDGCETGARVEVSDRGLSLPADMRQTMYRHELGHVLGLKEHSEDLGDLMNAHEDRDAQNPIDASPAEIATLHSIYGVLP